MNVPEDQIVINRSLDQVFSFVANPVNDPMWHTTVVEVRQTSAGAVGMGSNSKALMTRSDTH